MMYTMPKNILSICVNFALATQRDIFCQKCDMMGFWRLLTLHERKTFFPFVQTILHFAMQKC